MQKICIPLISAMYYTLGNLCKLKQISNFKLEFTFQNSLADTEAFEYTSILFPEKVFSKAQVLTESEH